MKNNKLLIIALAIIISFGVLTGFTYQDSAKAMSIDEIQPTAETKVVEGTKYDVKYSYVNVLQSYFLELSNYCQTAEISCTITFEEFCDSYYEQSTYTISKYVNCLKIFIDEQTINALSLEILQNINLIAPFSTGGKGWWFGIGSTLPQEPNYEGFLFDIMPGDIIFEENMAAGFGHIGIIEGSFHDSSFKVDYWRVIEAVQGYGVIRSVLDADRMVEYKSHILTAYTAFGFQMVGAVAFAIEQLGKGYTFMLDSKPIAADSWMCSTMIWAAYMHQGLDLCPGDNIPAISPKLMFNTPYLLGVTAASFNFLELRVVKSYYVFPAFWNWDIKFSNPNNVALSVTYNSKLCHQNDARYFVGLTDLVSITIAPYSSITKRITFNGNAGFVAASINTEFNGKNYRLISYVDGLEYSKNVGYTNTIKYYTKLA